MQRAWGNRKTDHWIGMGSKALGEMLLVPLTPRGSLECNPEIPAFPREEY